MEPSYVQKAVLNPPNSLKTTPKQPQTSPNIPKHPQTSSNIPKHIAKNIPKHPQTSPKHILNTPRGGTQGSQGGHRDPMGGYPGIPWVSTTGSQGGFPWGPRVGPLVPWALLDHWLLGPSPWDPGPWGLGIAAPARRE